MTFPTRVIALLLSASVAGCTVGPDYDSPAIALNAAYITAADAGRPITPETGWWHAFKDPLLDRIVDSGLAGNLDIGQAFERIAQARANLDIARSDTVPSLSGSSSSTFEGTTGKSDSLSTSERNLTNSTALDVSWLLDIWGKYRRNREASLASLDASFANADTARLTLLSEITTEYVNLRLYQAQAAIARDTIASRRETLALVREQQAMGLSSGLQVAQTLAALNIAEASLPGYEISFYQSANRIAYLTGQQPGTFLEAVKKGARIPAARFQPSSSIPADLLRNRPDIRSAERQLASKSASIGVAAADLYPSLTLTGSMAVTVAAAATGGSSQLLNGSFGPVADIPIFDGGARKAKVTLAESEAREQYLAWKDSVLNGVREVENALVAWQRQTRQVEALRESANAYSQALELAQESYKGGTSAFLDVLDAERSLFEARLSLASAEAQRALNFITLCVAAGGGYRAGGDS